MNDGRRMTVRLSDREDGLVRSTAMALGVTDSEVIRLALAGLAGRFPIGVTERSAAEPVPREVVEMREALDRVVAGIRRIGVNVNQVVRMAHVNGWTDEDIPGLRELPGVVDRMDVFVREAVDDVGK